MLVLSSVAKRQKFLRLLHHPAVASGWKCVCVDACQPWSSRQAPWWEVCVHDGLLSFCWWGLGNRVGRVKGKMSRPNDTEGWDAAGIKARCFIPKCFTYKIHPPSPCPWEDRALAPLLAASHLLRGREELPAMARWLFSVEIGTAGWVRNSL